MALNLIFSDVIWNLETISSLDNHQTLLVFGDKLNFDNRLFQSVRRTFTDDSRTQIASAIEKTLALAKEIFTSYQSCVYMNPTTLRCQEQDDVADNIVNNLKLLESKKDGFLRGLQILSTFERYKGDPSFQIKIGLFTTNIKALADKCAVLRSKYESLLKQTDSKSLDRSIVSVGTPDDGRKKNGLLNYLQKTTVSTSTPCSIDAKRSNRRKETDSDLEDSLPPNNEGQDQDPDQDEEHDEILSPSAVSSPINIANKK